MPFDQAGYGVSDNLALELAVLRKARFLIHKRSMWCQHILHRKYLFMPPQYCMIGALDKASSIKRARNVRIQAEERLSRYLPDQYFYLGVSTFNDNPEREHHEVIAVFDRAIADLERSMICPIEN